MLRAALAGLMVGVFAPFPAQAQEVVNESLAVAAIKHVKHQFPRPKIALVYWPQHAANAASNRAIAAGIGATVVARGVRPCPQDDCPTHVYLRGAKIRGDKATVDVMWRIPTKDGKSVSGYGQTLEFQRVGQHGWKFVRLLGEDFMN